MMVSNLIGSIPFMGSTDATRLQMASRQLAQTTTHLNCERPYVLGENWYHLTNSTRLYRYQAKENGKIVYKNNDIMIVVFNNDRIKIFEIPEFLHTSHDFATRLRFARPIGKFEAGDLLYEYDCFIDSVPAYGYNVSSMFFPFFGINFEDCIVISESLSERIRYQKIEKIEIPVYTFSLFKQEYTDSKYGFIPEIGHKIKKNIVAVTASSKSANKKNSLSTYNFYNFASVISNSTTFNADYIVSKLHDATVTNIKINQVQRSPLLIDKQLAHNIKLIKNDYHSKVKLHSTEISSLLGKKYAENILKKYYISQNPKYDFQYVGSFADLAYVIEITLIKDEKLQYGDKLADRYANKGVVGFILPDHLRPYNTETGEPIDLILGPLSVYARSNFGMVIEGLIGKTIKSCEQKIIFNKDNKEYVFKLLKKLSELSTLLSNPDYSKEILELIDRLKSSDKLYLKFIKSIINFGLFFEAKGFCSVNLEEIENFIENNFEVSPDEKITFKPELFDFMRHYLNHEDIEIPENEIVYEKIYNVPLYIEKLKQLASVQFSARDIGEYSKASKQPIKDAYGQNKGSHIGTMEFDALIAHNNINTIREFHTVKSDSIDMKKDLNVQMISTGEYNLSNKKSKSYTKLIIDSLITFLSQN